MEVTQRVVAGFFAPDADTPVPDLTVLDGVHELRRQPSSTPSVVYLDTAGLGLSRAGVTLRRNAGGVDEGWHVQVGQGQSEWRHPLSRSGSVPPKVVRDLVAGWVRGGTLAPVATATTARTSALLIGADGVVLAELTDTHVTTSIVSPSTANAPGTTVEEAPMMWREWTVRLVDGDVSLLEAADHLLAASGAVPSTADGAVAAVLVTPARAPRRPKPGKPVSRLVHARLVEQVDALARRDVDARRGTDDGVHRLRVAARRLRALLASFRSVLDRDQTDPIRDELRWLADMLGEARDAAVVHGRLRQLVADEPRNQVHGPVLRRLRSTFDGRGKRELVAALSSQRYFDLRDRLDQLAADPPWTDVGDTPARDVAAKVLRKEVKRARNLFRAATPSDEPDDVLHDARKAVKRVRYAAETIEPVAGRAAHRLGREARAITGHLGDLQDTTVTRTELLAVARTAMAAGEPTFTYGRLHAREQERAAQLAAALDINDTIDQLKAHGRATRRALRDR